MFNPIKIALTEVVNSIPPEILEMAVRKYNYRTGNYVTVAGFINRAIIHDRVAGLCNLSAGRIKTIPLRMEWLESQPSDHAGYAGDDGPYSLFRIPPAVRDNLPITGVISVQYPYNTYLGGGLGDLNMGTGGYNLNEQVSEILNSYTLATPRNHPVARALNGDLIQLMPTQYSHQSWLLTVRLAFDDQFTNLHENGAKTLAKLIVLATKQWCYTNLIVDIDRAVQECGADLPTVKSIVEEYRDAGKEFEETLIQWQGCGNIDPRTRYQIFVYQMR